MTSETLRALDAARSRAGLDGDLAELVRRQVREHPVEGPTGGKRCADDDDIVLHVLAPLCPVGKCPAGYCPVERASG